VLFLPQLFRANIYNHDLEFGESLDGLSSSGQDSKDVESNLYFVRWGLFLLAPISTYSLAKGSALTDCDDVALLNTEGWGDVGSQVAVSLLVSGVLGNEVKVLSSDDNGSVHLGRDDLAGQDSSSDGDHTSEWTFLVCKPRISILLFVCFLLPKECLWF